MSSSLSIPPDSFENPIYNINRYVLQECACLLFALCAGNISGALPEKRPGAFTMVFDVSIHILGIGFAVVGNEFFIVALPLALSSGNTGDA